MKNADKARDAADRAMEEGKLEVAEGCARMAIQVHLSHRIVHSSD